MKTLAIDTSNQTLTVTSAQDHELLALEQHAEARQHSMALLPAVTAVLAASQWELTDVDQLVVADGPGSFTGLRIAVTVAKTLATCLDCPLVTVSSLAVLAHQVPTTDGLVVALMDARNQNVFAGGYAGNDQIIPDQHISIEQLLVLVAEWSGAVTFVGDVTPFTDTIATQFPTAVLQVCQPDGRGILRARDWYRPVAAPADLVPNYLRRTQAELNWLADNQQVLPDNLVQHYAQTNE